MRALLWVIGVGYILNGAFMLLAPQLWYDTIPGMPFFGPFNRHFVRDISLIYLVSGGGFVWGLLRRQHAYLVVAAAWPALHALYHVQVWVARGFALDEIFVVNVAAIQFPAWAAVFAISRLRKA